MHDQVLQAILRSIETRNSVALLSVTAGTGIFADQVGRHVALWMDEAQTPVGDLALGEVTAQVCNHQGKPQSNWAVSTASAPVRGDSTDSIVNWPDTNLSALIGQPITLRFRLRNADLYSFWFSEPL